MTFDPASVATKLSNEEKRVLHLLKATPQATNHELQQLGSFASLVEVTAACSWLMQKQLVREDQELIERLELSDEGRRCLELGLPERRALAALTEAGGSLPMAHLTALPTLEPHERSVAVGQLRQKNLIAIARGAATLTPQGRAAADGKLPEERVLDALRGGPRATREMDQEGVGNLKKRPHLFKRREEIRRSYRLTQKGAEVAALPLELERVVTQLTSELIQTGGWEGGRFKPYDVQMFATAVYPGKRHPLTRLIQRIRRVFLDMGFTEIGGQYVRSAFWNLDALFVPQDHPARDMQDTFYVEEPATLPIPPDYEAIVRAAHERGADTGSTGWGGRWSRDEAGRALLRTHTTVDTITHLARSPHAPQRVFTIGRVFRKERIDATHLPEFHQVEGIIVEDGANLAQLITVLTTFYEKMGFSGVRVRPAYFPYTEPSLEVDVRFKDRWMELGGAGIFRAEVTLPLGVSAPVLAWGLGLERLAMMVSGLQDIRQLYMSDVDWLRQSPLSK